MSSFKEKLYNGFLWRICYYASSFILNILISHYLGAAKSGVFYLLLNNLAFVVLLLSIGIDSAIGYFNARKEFQPSQLLTLSICWSFISIAILWIVYAVLVKFNLTSALPDEAYLIIYIAGSLITTFLSSLIFSLGDNKTPGVVLGISNLFLVFLLPSNPLFSHLISIETYTNIYLVFALFPAIIFIVVLKTKKISLSFSLPPLINWKPFFQFAMQSFAFSILYILLLRCDYWIVNYFCSDADLGNYLQASKLNQLITLVPTLISFTLFPLIVSQVHQQKMVEIKVVKLARVYFFIGLHICCRLLGFPHSLWKNFF
jgi:O-antigen/teichoic acid export membrane protein